MLNIQCCKEQVIFYGAPPNKIQRLCLYTLVKRDGRAYMGPSLLGTSIKWWEAIYPRAMSDMSPNSAGPEVFSSSDHLLFETQL